jgi:endonuclease III
MAEVQVTVPDGMTQEEFMKAFQTFQKARIAAQTRDKAVRAAMKQLIANHKAEYDKLVESKLAETSAPSGK